MSELIADLFISVDGSAKGSRSPAFAQLPDIGLDLVGQSVLDRRIVLSEYRPSGAPRTPVSPGPRRPRR